MKMKIKLVNRPLISKARNCSGESPGTNTDKLRTTIYLSLIYLSWPANRNLWAYYRVSSLLRKSQQLLRI